MTSNDDPPALVPDVKYSIWRKNAKTVEHDAADGVEDTIESVTEQAMKRPTKPVLRCGCSLTTSCSGARTASCIAAIRADVDERDRRLRAEHQELDRLARAALEALESVQADGRDPALEPLESGEPSESPLTRCGPKLQDVSSTASGDASRGEPPGNETVWKPATHMQLSKSQVEKLKAGKSLLKPLIRISRQGANGTFMPFIERRAESLKQLQAPNGEWEYFEAILDSGASVTVIPASLGRDYEVQEGEASRAGVTYEIADGTAIPNLGEKLMPIMTSEGTTRGLRA